MTHVADRAPDHGATHHVPNMPDGVLRLLVVEDDPIDQFLTCDALQAYDAAAQTICCVGSLEAACTRLAQDRFDAVVLDLGMPGRTSEAVLDAVLAAAGQVPVIVLSNNESDALAHSAILAGAQDFILKGSIVGWALGRAIHLAIMRATLRHPGGAGSVWPPQVAAGAMHIVA